MTPVQFLARLAALVPPPRHPLVRFYGVWAPHSQWRSRVVRAATAKKTRVPCATSTATDPRATPVTPAGLGIDASGTAASSPTPDGAQATSVPHPSRPKPQLPSAAALPRAEDDPLAPSHPAGEELRFRGLSRLAWATLYQRVFDIDPLDCSSCGGRMRFVQVIEDVVRARSELRRRNLPEQPPPLSRARSPNWVD
jgi:hypothetical protein